MKKIAVVTATRAEYGLLSPVIKELRKSESNEFRVELLVTGTHLSEKYGRTIEEINDRIDHEIIISVASDTELDISKNQAETLVRFTELFIEEKYNAVILLGDRYETLAIAVAAGNTRTPVFHLCGGDTTEGANDEWIRHSITKISYLHFVTNEESLKRVLQLGEEPSRVFNFGSTSIDNILMTANMSKEEALASIGLSDCRYALCTYHPVTMESGSVDVQISEFLKVMPDISNLHVFSSLGVRRYLSLMKYAEFVLGNSSSGIIESPVFHVPTVNIGDRQKGRLQSESIINCSEKSEAIIMAITKAMSKEHRLICNGVVSPYGDGCAAKQIAMKIINVVFNGEIDLKKKFYDLGEM